MSENRQDVTARVQRIESLEERFGIEISALYSLYKTDQTGSILHVNFDLVARSGFVEENFLICVSVYNSDSQLVDTKTQLINKERFLGFDSVKIWFHDLDDPKMIRLFPKNFM